LSWTTATQANTLNFGGLTNNSSCSTAGNSNDRSCTSSGSVNNGANDATASLGITGQASADHGLTTNPTAIADITVSYTIPYTVTRDWYTTVGPNPQLVIPNQSILLDLSYSGNTAHDNSQATGGLGNAQMYSLTVTSAAFGVAVLSDANSTSGGGGSETGPALTDNLPDLGGNLTRNQAGPTVEINAGFDIPTNYRDWTDLVVPFSSPDVNNNVYTGTQSFTDTLTISFRLRAESRASGSVSVTGGEAIACAGQTSTMGSFDIDNSLACGSGATINATVTQTGTTSALVPEPGTLMLIGSGLAGLVAFGARRRS
jgi:hypothetical protein